MAPGARGPEHRTGRRPPAACHQPGWREGAVGCSVRGPFGASHAGRIDARPACDRNACSRRRPRRLRSQECGITAGLTTCLVTSGAGSRRRTRAVAQRMSTADRRPVTCCWSWEDEDAGCASSFAIGTRSSAAGSMTPSAPRVPRCCGRRCRHPTQTPTRSGGSAPSARNAWTGCSSLGEALGGSPPGLRRALQPAPGTPGAPAPGAGPSHRTDNRRRGSPRRRASARPARCLLHQYYRRAA